MLRIIENSILVFTILILSCSKNRITNDGSENNVVGRLVNADGTPAKNSKVRFVPSGKDPRQGLAKILAQPDSTVTDADGNYTAQVEPGIYNVLASGGSGVLFEDSVPIMDTSTEIPTDTLRAPGSITGLIELQNADDPRTVFILVLGTYILTSPSLQGRFTLSGMAEGTYDVRILTTLDNYNPLDERFTVTAGRTDTLAGSLVLPFRGIPIAKNLHYQYDTLKQIAVLSWDETDTTLTGGYNVYRKHQDSSFVRINTKVLTSTSFSDSNLIQDAGYEYKITVVNKGDNEGAKSAGINLMALGLYCLADSIGATGSGDGQFTGIRGIDIDWLGNIYVLDETRIQKFSSSGAFQKRVIQLPSSNYQDMAIDTSLNIYIADYSKGFVYKTDSSGNITNTISGLTNPQALCINNRQQIYMAEWSNKINIYDDSLKLLKSITGQFIASDIAVDSSGNIYIADGPSDRIRKVDSNGVVIKSWGETGMNIGQFDIPLAISTDTLIHLFVADGDNHRIQIFDDVGNFIGRVQLSLKTYPADLEINKNGDLFITDIGGQYSGGQYRILKYSRR